MFASGLEVHYAEPSVLESVLAQVIIVLGKWSQVYGRRFDHLGLLNLLCLCASRLAPFAFGHRHSLSERRDNASGIACISWGMATPSSILRQCPGSSSARSGAFAETGMRTHEAGPAFTPMGPLATMWPPL